MPNAGVEPNVHRRIVLRSETFGHPAILVVSFGVAPDVVDFNATAIGTRTQYRSICITRAKQSNSNCEQSY